MAARQLPVEFQEFIGYLNRHRAKYLLIGGWAVGVHANPRLTADIDFVIGTGEDNLDRVLRALADFGIPGVPKNFFLIEGNTFRIGRSPLKIDILTKALGIDFEVCYRRKQSIRMGGIRVKTISREDLILSKLAAHRPKDLGDVEELQSMVRRRGPRRRKF